MNKPNNIRAEREMTESGSFVFRDFVELDEEAEPPRPFHRLGLTEGEQAVLWAILRYVHARLRNELAWSRGAAQVDFTTLLEKADLKGMGLL